MKRRGRSISKIAKGLIHGPTAKVLSIILLGVCLSAIASYKMKMDKHAVLTFIEIGRYGRLGNQIFQVASTIGIALDNEMSFSFPEHIESSDVGILFNIKGDIISEGYVPKILEIDQIYEPVKVPRSLHGVISLHGYYQSFFYFNHHTTRLKKILRPNHHMVTTVLSKFPKLMVEGSVGIHVRRGDYIHQENHDLYTQIGIDYFEKALERIPHVERVFVASDDIDWCRENFKHLPYEVVYTNGNDIYDDFLVLALSHSLIIPNSSFGWWAAYLKGLHYGNGTVIAPSPWYQEAGKLGYLNKNSPYFYLKNWEVIDVRLI